MHSPRSRATYAWRDTSAGEPPELLTNLDGPIADAVGAPTELRAARNTGPPRSGAQSVLDHTDGAWPLDIPAGRADDGAGRRTASSSDERAPTASHRTAAGLKAYHRHALVASSHSAALVFVGHATA